MNNVDFKWKTIHQFMQDIELKTTRTTDNVGSPPPTAPPEQTLPVGQSINQFWWCGTNSLRISFGTLGALTWIYKISGISESSCRTWIARWWNSCNNDQLHMELSYYSFQNIDMHIRFTIFTFISTSSAWFISPRGTMSWRWRAAWTITSNRTKSALLGTGQTTTRAVSSCNTRIDII